MKYKESPVNTPEETAVVGNDIYTTINDTGTE